MNCKHCGSEDTYVACLMDSFQGIFTCRSCGQVSQENPVQHTMRYETEAMSDLRTILKSMKWTDEEIDVFGRALTDLETKGFTLIGPEI